MVTDQIDTCMNDMENVYSPGFSHDFFKILLFDILFQNLEVHFMNSYNNDQMFVGPLSIKTKHLFLVLSKHRKYGALSQLTFPVPFCFVY